MLSSQMDERCPENKFIGVAKLPNFQVFFSGFSRAWNGASASIHPLSGNYVWGALFELNDEDFAKLDQIEGANEAPPRHNKKLVQCISEEGQTVRALTYIMRENRPAKPTKNYLDKIVHGAQTRGLSEKYIEELKRIAQST